MAVDMHASVHGLQWSPCLCAQAWVRHAFWEGHWIGEHLCVTFDQHLMEDGLLSAAFGRHLTSCALEEWGW